MRFPFSLASSFFVSSIHSKDVAKTRGEHKALKALWMDRKLEATIFFFFVCVWVYDGKTLNCTLLSF